MRMLAVEALSAAGYRCENAANAAEAMATLRAAQGRFDAIIIDSALPDKEGQILLADLRTQYADLPAILTVADAADPRKTGKRRLW